MAPIAAPTIIVPAAALLFPVMVKRFNCGPHKATNTYPGMNTRAMGAPVPKSSRTSSRAVEQSLAKDCPLPVRPLRLVPSAHPGFSLDVNQEASTLIQASCLFQFAHLSKTRVSKLRVSNEQFTLTSSEIQ